MTLGFNHLGNLGRLGNQMFEFATLRGIAAHHGYDICVPPEEHDGIENYSLHQCFKLDHIPTGFAPEQYVQEPHFHFSQSCLIVALTMRLCMDSFRLKDTLHTLQIRFVRTSRFMMMFFNPVLTL